ncbi:RNA-binding protein [Butyrivibrio hungatei]|uniref:RNA-binding protein n=1 Tax=Butyrivibrio hungatei TaxID=185008 RepID=A0A1D9P5A6_9FIRM|nr:RNA-binding protein [Butyrivibrio hungatei]
MKPVMLEEFRLMVSQPRHLQMLRWVTRLQ